jgi:peptide/nickel transport system permease protein
MAGGIQAIAQVDPLLLRPERGTSARVAAAVWRFARRKPIGAFAGLLVVVVLLIGIFADQVAPHDPLTTAPIDSLRSPSGSHPFGTDVQGRDVLSRIMYGTRISVGVGFGAVLLGVSLGTVLGLVSGYFGGWLDTAFQRVVDILMAFPTLILAMAIVAAAGAGTSGGTPSHGGLLGSLEGIGAAVKNNRNLILAIGITLIPAATRLVRSSVLIVREHQYVEAARALGATDTRLMRLHILPNVFAPIVVLVSVVVGQAIIAEASLSFLGLGAQPPTPSWGEMLSGSAQRYIEKAPWLVIFPGVAIALVVYAFNMFGDALRDVLDPRLRGS